MSFSLNFGGFCCLLRNLLYNNNKLLGKICVVFCSPAPVVKAVFLKKESSKSSSVETTVIFVSKIMIIF